MFAAQRRPEKAVAYRELRKHLMYLAGWCLAIRLAPAVLDAAYNRPSSN